MKQKNGPEVHVIFTWNSLMYDPCELVTCEKDLVIFLLKHFVGYNFKIFPRIRGKMAINIDTKIY